MWNGNSLLAIEFKPTNINLYGTKLMDLLFTDREMANGSFDASNDRNVLDEERVNLLKGIFYCFILFYLIFLYSFKIFKLPMSKNWRPLTDSLVWPNVLRSLKQKLIDKRKQGKTATRFETPDPESKFFFNCYVFYKHMLRSFFLYFLI